jgi:REP element-mobilizing transposase RayT
VQQLDIDFHEWGGRRDGAGRPRSPGRGRVSHRPRERHRAAHPVHVTMRVRGGLPSMREPVLFSELRHRIGDANRSLRLRNVFRVVHFSVQDNHIHMIVEASDASALSRGVQGLAVRLARRTNSLLRIRGGFWGDRFHSRELTSPRAVRNALVYVLMNAKKHGLDYAGIDPLSSALWFCDGFSPRLEPRAEPPPVRDARTWLGSVGWHRHGLLRVHERPRSAS